MKHLFTTLLASSCALASVAETVPALITSQGTSVALQEVVSVKFDAFTLSILKTDGTTVSEPLQPFTFGTVDLQGLTQVKDEPASFQRYDMLGRPATTDNGFSISRAGLTYAVGQNVTSGAETASSVSAPVPTRALAATTALQVQKVGIDPQVALSRVDSLTFSDDLNSLYLHMGMMGSALPLGEVEGVSFPELQEAVTIEYCGDHVEGVNPQYFDYVTIRVSDAHVVVSCNAVSDEVEYQLSGTTDNGSFRIYSDYKWQATLMNLNLTNPSGPAINSQTGKKGTIKSPNGTVNYLADGAVYVESQEDQKGCVFGEGQLIFNGKGTLNITASNKHAICSDDYVSLDNGTVNVLAAVSDAVHAKDSVIIQGCNVTLAPSSDGIDCDGPITLRQGENGIPVVSITTTGDGAKGIKSGKTFLMTDGQVTINQSGKSEVKEDGDTSRVIGIKAQTIRITGGSVVVNSSAQKGKAYSADQVEGEEHITFNQL